MAIHKFTFFPVLLSALMLPGCGGNVAPQQAAPNALAKVWTFKAVNFDCTMTITIMPAPAEYGEAVVWTYSKSSPVCYWNPGDNASLGFLLQKQPDGSWASVHQTIKCDTCIPGHTQATTDNILEPGGYRIIPTGPGTTGETGYHPCWQYDVQTMARDLCSDSALIPWRTDAYMENGMLVSEQWENCPGDGCAHEKWYFTPDGKELLRVIPTNPAYELVRM